MNKFWVVKPVFVTLFKGKIILHKEGKERDLEGRVWEVGRRLEPWDLQGSGERVLGGDREEKEAKGRKINTFFKF